MPWVIPEYCEGCTACVAACKKGCLNMFATNEEDIFISWMENPDACTGCGLCAQQCVIGGIIMTAYCSEAKERFLTYIANGNVRKA